jgi:hypothetical protein
MPFELAKEVSFIIHIILVFSIFGAFLIQGWRKIGPVIFMYKIYGCILAWYLICKLFNGCPITYLENYLSVVFYGSYFYPNYSFKDSIVSVFIKTPSNYIPLVITVAYQLISLQWRSRIRSRKNL